MCLGKSAWRSTCAGQYQYQYNGKELNEDLGLNWLDYGARWYDASIGRWNAVDPLAEKYNFITPYAYVANMPTIAIDPDGGRIVIVNNAHYQRVLQDLGRIYATRRGRAIIDRLAASNTVYRIDGSTHSIYGDYFWGTRYNSLTNNLTYSQDFHEVDDSYTYSHITLAHELYHAFQDEENMHYNSEANKEGDAVRFENYIRDVYGGSEINHRTKHGGITVVRGATAFASNGERIDLSTVEVRSWINTNNQSGEEGEDKPRRVYLDLHRLNIRHVLQYMTKNGVEYLKLELDQRSEQNERP